MKNLYQQVSEALTTNGLVLLDGYEARKARVRSARYWLGFHSAVSGQVWGGAYKEDRFYQAGFTDGLSHSLGDPSEEGEDHGRHVMAVDSP